MAPFRGSSRGGRARGAGFGRRGGPVASGRIARSGIKTKNGYKKFDSQRVKEIVESETSEGNSPAPSERTSGSEDGRSEDEEFAPKIRAYNALLQSFQPPTVDERRERKRRKVDLPIDVTNSDDNSDSIEEDRTAEGDVLDENVNENATDEEAGLEEDSDFSDPYEAHFAGSDEEELSRSLAAVKKREWQIDKQSTKELGTLTTYLPIDAGVSSRPTPIKSTADLRLKHRLGQTAPKLLPTLDHLQQVLARHIFAYQDVLLGSRGPENAASLRQIACLHALNHILKGRDKVLKNTVRISHAGAPEDMDLRDQGFTRPKVLILVETRQEATKYADCIVELFQPEQQENKQRFKDSFSASIEETNNMPEDYQELFGGNNDNNFMTAIKFTRKTLKFFSAFYSSDIILASPLGLRRIIEHEDVKKRDHDFLSSIEIAIIDQAHAMQMQNWENVEVVTRHLNLPIKEAHGCDFNRVRHWYLDNNACFFRQTLLFSAYITPEITHLFNNNMQNRAGKIKLQPVYPGALARLSTTTSLHKQTFSRLTSPSPTMDPDTRFKYFTASILPTLLRLPKPSDNARGILIFIPSYYDFLRIRNYFATSTQTENISFGAIHEYTDVSAQRRARSHFLSGRHAVLLYTQRAHHFFRLRVKGVKKVVMYGLPDPAVFYEEVVDGFLGTSLREGSVSAEEASVRVLFSKWDGMKLERIVGSTRVKDMLRGVGDTFDFV